MSGDLPEAVEVALDRFEHATIMQARAVPWERSECLVRDKDCAYDVLRASIEYAINVAAAAGAGKDVSAAPDKSLRDEFAESALIGLLAGGHDADRRSNAYACAYDAYVYADAMLSMRGK